MSDDPQIIHAPAAALDAIRHVAHPGITVSQREHRFGPQWWATFPDRTELAWFDCPNLRQVLDTYIRRGQAAQAIRDHLEQK